MALKSVYPETHYGSFAADAGWKELLPAGVYGVHPAWHSSVESFEAHKGKTALIPWLLFNRHLWEEKAEALPGDSESLNLLVPHAASTERHPRGWYVRLMVSEELEIQGLEAVSMDDDSAPASEGFQVLPKGALPPPVVGPNRQRTRLLASFLLLTLSAILIGAVQFLFGTSTDQEIQYSGLTADLSALRSQEAVLRSEWEAHQSLGVAPLRATHLLMDAIWFDGQVDMQGHDVFWKGDNGQPFEMSCGTVQTDSGRAGWRHCRWPEL